MHNGRTLQTCLVIKSQFHMAFHVFKMDSSEDRRKKASLYRPSKAIKDSETCLQKTSCFQENLDNIQCTYVYFPDQVKQRKRPSRGLNLELFSHYNNHRPFSFSVPLIVECGLVGWLLGSASCSSTRNLNQICSHGEFSPSTYLPQQFGWVVARKSPISMEIRLNSGLPHAIDESGYLARFEPCSELDYVFKVWRETQASCRNTNKDIQLLDSNQAKASKGAQERGFWTHLNSNLESARRLWYKRGQSKTAKNRPILDL